jgi:hypothetical protein
VGGAILFFQFFDHIVELSDFRFQLAPGFIELFRRIRQAVDEVLASRNQIFAALLAQ